MHLRPSLREIQEQESAMQQEEEFLALVGSGGREGFEQSCSWRDHPQLRKARSEIEGHLLEPAELLVEEAEASAPALLKSIEAG